VDEVAADKARAAGNQNCHFFNPNIAPPQWRILLSNYLQVSLSRQRL